MSNLRNTSFALQASSLCHEMIHQYDLWYGDYQDRYKAFLITGEKMKSHENPAFKEKMKMALDNHINVMKNVPKNQSIQQSDSIASEFAIQALKESKNGLQSVVNDSTAEVQFVGNGRYAIIQEYD